MSGIPSAMKVLFISCLIAVTTADDYKWIVQDEIKPEDLPSNLNRETSHDLLLKILSKKSERHLLYEMRSEFCTMATGKDFYKITADENENKEYHAIAEATYKLAEKLAYTKIVNKVLRDAYINGAKSVASNSDITKGLPAIKETIEKGLQESPALFEEYKRLKNEALSKPLPADYKIYYYEIPKTLEEAKNIVSENLNNVYLKKIMIHNIFATYSYHGNRTNPGTVLLINSILKLAKDPEIGAKVETLYDEVVTEAANKIEDVDGKGIDESKLKEKFMKIGREFFQSLGEKFENDPTVKTKLAETKKELQPSPQ